MKKCKKVENLIVNHSIRQYNFKDMVCNHVTSKCNDMNFDQLLENWDEYSTKEIVEYYLMEVRNPILIDE